MQDISIHGAVLLVDKAAFVNRERNGTHIIQINQLQVNHQTLSYVFDQRMMAFLCRNGF